MLSAKVIEYCKNKDWWFEESTKEYEQALLTIGIDLHTDIAAFYLHAEDGPTLYSRQHPIYQLCWFILHTDYNLCLDSAHQALALPKAYIPLDSFEGEYGYFYNRETDEVLGLGLGQPMKEFAEGRLKPQWSTFNEFLEWYFDVTA